MANVPNVPGVPSLSSYLPSAITLLVVDAIQFLVGSQSLWNVLLDGEQAFDFRSMAGFSYKQEWIIADYPTDQGGFFSYDKVQMPFECRLRITSGGTEQERQALLDEVTAASNSLNLYDIVTPEKVYASCNVSHLDYERRAENGVGMIVIDIAFQEIRSSEAVAFSNTQQPGSAGQQGLGNVQAQPANVVGNTQSANANVAARFPVGDVQ